MLPKFTKDALSPYENSLLKLDIGNYSYGTPNLRYDIVDFAIRRLVIGRYCSIGDDVQIFIGRHGRHSTDSLTTYPLGMVVAQDVLSVTDLAFPPVAEHLQPHLDRSLDVVIGNDVWIGLGVTILAGVTIGNGAVIGAKAVVTRNIEPFSVAVGSPASEIKKRHRPDVVRRLQSSEWWLREPDDLYLALEGLLHSSDIDEVLLRLER
jgi:acetyltransferase-like isoleucine patch superfamily enzyme